MMSINQCFIVIDKSTDKGLSKENKKLDSFGNICSYLIFVMSFDKTYTNFSFVAFQQSPRPRGSKKHI